MASSVTVPLEGIARKRGGSLRARVDPPPSLTAPGREQAKPVAALDSRQTREERVDHLTCLPRGAGAGLGTPDAHLCRRQLRASMTKATYPSLAGRSVLVTGGASGIGEAIVRGFARNGASVALLDVDVEAGESLAAELGATTQFLACDLTDVAALRDAVREAESRLGPIRALVNNAANDQRFPLEEVTPEPWDASP